MRKLIVAAFTSLDGVMQAPGGPTEDPSGGFAFGGWTFPHWDEAMNPFMDVFDQPFDLLLGRRTYDIFAGHWPRMPADDPIGAVFNRVTKYVATSSPDTLDWANSVALTGDVPAAVAALKQGDGPPLLTQGSSVLIHALLEHGLVDELRLMTFPVLLGQGKRWFDGAVRPGDLTLQKSAVSPTGVVMAVYHPAGEVRTGSFALPED